MKEFTIKIDLKNFFEDERKRSLLLVDPKWNRVSDLAKRIETIFELKDIRFLTEDGCYVPLQEPIRVVATEKTLKAFVLELNRSNETNKVKKRKYFSLDDVESCSTPYQATEPKRSKSQNTHLNEKHKAVPQKVSNSNNKFHNKENEKLVDKVSSVPDNCKEVENIKSSAEKICSSIMRPSKKNKSLANKSVGHFLNCLSNVSSIRHDEINSSSSKSMTKKNKTCSLINGTLVNEETPSVVATNELHSSHIRFDKVEEDANAEQPNSTIQDDDGNITANDYSTTNTLVKDTPAKIIFRCALMQMPNTKTRTFDLRPKTNDSNVEILEDIRILPVNKYLLPSASVTADATINSIEEKSKNSLASNLQEYSICEQSSVILLDDTKFDDSRAATDEASDMQTSQLVDAGCGGNVEMKLMLSKSKPLENLPSVDDVLIFKIVDKEILTDYIAAKCEYVNRRSKLVTVSLINFPKGLEILLNQFSANIDGSSSNIEKITLKISEMIDLKVVNMNINHSIIAT